jgi:hypothetical protein
MNLKDTEGSIMTDFTVSYENLPAVTEKNTKCLKIAAVQSIS